ncbi:hypothetical protein ACTXT7_003363 [Hymenolepis weldensis]
MIDQTYQNSSLPPPVEWTSREIRRYAKGLQKAKGKKTMKETLTNFLLEYRSTPPPALGEKSPAEVLMGRKLRTVQEVMLSKKTLPDRKREGKKNGLPVDSCDYHVEVGKDTWVRHHNQLRRRLAKPTTDKRYLSLNSLLNTFSLTHVLSPRCPVIDHVMVPPRTARIRWKPSRFQVDPSSKTYGSSLIKDT